MLIAFANNYVASLSAPHNVEAHPILLVFNTDRALALYPQIIPSLNSYSSVNNLVFRPRFGTKREMDQ